MTDLIVCINEKYLGGLKLRIVKQLLECWEHVEVQGDYIERYCSCQNTTLSVLLSYQH